MSAPGISYEIFVQSLMQTIVSADTEGWQRNIEVEHNKILTDRNGVQRQFDVYWKYEIGGLCYETIIECKDYATAVSIDKIDALLDKLHDFPNVRGIIATTVGYQSGAEIKAKSNNIDILLVRKADNREFTLPDGTPLVRQLEINVTMFPPAEITNFIPKYDVEWVEKNTTIKRGDEVSISEQNDSIFIEDTTNGTKVSLRDIANGLRNASCPEAKAVGKYRNEVAFDNAYLVVESQNIRLKILAYVIEYVILPPLKKVIKIDGADMYAGVVEYLLNSKKSIVGKDGKIKTVCTKEQSNW